jgi:hypothetical protein
MLQWLPLLLGAIGIGAFFMLDAKQLSTDKIMYDRWSFLLMTDDNKVFFFLQISLYLVCTNRVRAALRNYFWYTWYMRFAGWHLALHKKLFKETR